MITNYITLPNYQSQCDYHKALIPGTYLHIVMGEGTYEFSQGIESVTIVQLTTSNIQKIWDYLRFKYLQCQYQKTKDGTDLAFVDPKDVDFDEDDYFYIVPEVLNNIMLMAYKISPKTYDDWLKIIKEDKVMAHNYFSENYQEGGFNPDDLRFDKAKIEVTMTELFRILSMPKYHH